MFELLNPDLPGEHPHHLAWLEVWTPQVFQPTTDYYGASHWAGSLHTHMTCMHERQNFHTPKDSFFSLKDTCILFDSPCVGWEVYRHLLLDERRLDRV